MLTKSTSTKAYPVIIFALTVKAENFIFATIELSEFLAIYDLHFATLLVRCCCISICHREGKMKVEKC